MASLESHWTGGLPDALRPVVPAALSGKDVIVLDRVMVET
jgi:hypothetical protein